MCGDETLATTLRCLTSIELFMNIPYYSSHPLIEQQHKQGAFSCKENAFAMCLSDAALECFDKKDQKKAIFEELCRNANDQVYSSFLCLMSLSSVIRLPIESYYPISSSDVMDSLSIMFNCTIQPREMFELAKETDKIHIFRCAFQPVDYLEKKNAPKANNHYVPLCRKKSNICISDEALFFTPYLLNMYFPEILSTSFIKNANESLSAFQDVSPHKETQISVKPASSKKKFKQTSLDQVMTKRRKILEEPTTKTLFERRIVPSVVEIVSSNTSNSHALDVVTGYRYDISNFVNLSAPLTDQDKYALICNLWKPESTYDFPVTIIKGSGRRKFQYDWLNMTEFSWLAYSARVDGAFCLNCVLFGGESTHNASKLKQLFKEPFKTWDVALQRFRDHNKKSQVHKTATIRFSHFKEAMEQRSVPIDCQLNSIRHDQIKKNRERLRPIVDAILLCGRQNIALRGHRDDSKFIEQANVNTGNFQEILKYGARCGNSSLNDYLDAAPRNATYRSKTTQNQLIEICGDMLSSRIVEEVKHAKYFSILMDEATDCANIEQMSLVIRFVDKQFLIREDFLGFIPCTEGLSGEAVANAILKHLKRLKLSIDYCRGQGYDGAGNMAGKYSGAAARIMAIQEKAVYVHCNSHILNLCIASSCKEQFVRNMMDAVRVTSEFFRFSPKRFDLLKKIIKKELPNCRHKVIIDVCKTRWVARIDGLLNFIEAFPAIVQCLDEIKDNVDGHWNDGSTEKANGLYHSIVNFQFILVLVIVSGFLEITRPLTVQLQDSSLDANAAREKVSLLFVMLERFRSDIERKHETWFKNAADLAEAVGTLPSKPRTTRLQSHRPNTPAESILEYYRRVVSIPFLDHLISEIKKRFSERNLNILDATYGMPKNVLSNPEGWKERFSQFLNKYKDDLPQPRLLPTELEMWFEKCRLSKDSLPSNLGDVLKFADKATFPNILTGFLIFATIPVTTCTCERSVSTLRRLKTYLRNSMSESRLSALAMLNVHREIPLDIDEVIDLFAKKHPRRIILRDVINDD